MVEGAQPLGTQPRPAQLADRWPRTRTGPFPLLGRSRELAALRRVLRDARQSAGAAAVVRGEAGIGKTRLLAEILEHADGEGFQILSGSTDELALDRPFGPLIEAFGLHADSTDPRRAGIGRLVTGQPGLSIPSGAADLGFRIIDETVDLLERLATDHPVVVAFEDLHWADPATLRAVRAIGRAMPRLPVALFVTLRPFPECPELVRVIELVKALHDQSSQKAPDQQGSRDVGPGSLPRTLPLTILRRVSFLPAATLEILKVAAVLGREFSLAELAMVTGRSAVALLPELDGALRAGLLGESPAGLAFRHELIREALYHDLTPALRQGLHREVARVLTAAGAGLGRVADHLFPGASAADPEARRWLRPL